MIDGSERRKRQLAVRVFLKSAVNLISCFVKGTEVYNCLAVNHVELILQRTIKV